ncbi:hypothetical protein Tco_0018624 [Tanacetum coccineum]
MASSITRFDIEKFDGKNESEDITARGIKLYQVRYVSGSRRILISLDTLEKVGYTMKMQMGRFKGAKRNREAEVFHVSNDDVVVAPRRLKDKQLDEKANKDCLVNEQLNVHLGIKAGADIMVTGVPSQESAADNVAEKKKVNDSMKANLERLLKYNVSKTRWSSV